MKSRSRDGLAAKGLFTELASAGQTTATQAPKTYCYSYDIFVLGDFVRTLWTPHPKVQASKVRCLVFEKL